MFVVENNLRMLKDIVKKKSAKPLKFKEKDIFKKILLFK